MKLEHIALNVPDPQAAARWYESHLGMRIVRSLGEPMFIQFLADDDGSMIELYRKDDAPVPEYSGLSPFTLHLAFASTDIDADVERLRAAGARLEGGIDTNPAGDRLAFLRDPWGVAIQFVQRATPLL